MTIPPVRTVQTTEQAKGLVRLNQLARTRAAHRALTDDERKQLDDVLPCMHCGGWHSRACPRVRTMTWHVNGKLASVGYWPSDRVDWTGVVFDDADEVVPPPDPA